MAALREELSEYLFEKYEQVILASEWLRLIIIPQYWLDIGTNSSRDLNTGIGFRSSLARPMS